MRLAVLWLLAMSCLMYFSTYFLIRLTRTEIWEKDGNAYVIYPEDKVYLYYLHRPLSYIDGAITGMKFHFGRHK